MKVKSKKWKWTVRILVGIPLLFLVGSALIDLSYGLKEKHRIGKIAENYFHKEVDVHECKLKLKGNRIKDCYITIKGEKTDRLIRVSETKLIGNVKLYKDKK